MSIRSSRRHQPTTACLVAMLVVFGGGTAGCGRAPATDESLDNPSARHDSAGISGPASEPLAGRTSRPRPRYLPVAIAGAQALARLRAELGDERFATMLKVNRRDLAHVRQGDTLAVPDTLHDLLGLSPFPRVLSSAQERRKLLLVALSVQAFAAYDSGRLARWGPTSTGRESLQTPVGLYHTNWKDRERTSTFNDEWLLEWYVNLDNRLGISLHQYDLPGYPASHSCVRLLEDDAMWLHDWSESWKLSRDGRTVLQHGTPVVVFGTYDYGRRPPWKNLWRDSTATDVPVDEIDEALARWLPRPRAVVDSLPLRSASGRLARTARPQTSATAGQ